MHYDIYIFFSLQKESISTGCRKKMFGAIYIRFKTLLYTNLILISMNSIFVDLLHIKPFHQSIDNEQNNLITFRQSWPFETIYTECF